MNDAEAKRIALRAVRRRRQTAYEAVNAYINDHWVDFASLGAKEAVVAAERWLAHQDFGPMNPEDAVTLMIRNLLAETLTVI